LDQKKENERVRYFYFNTAVQAEMPLGGGGEISGLAWLCWMRNFFRFDAKSVCFFALFSCKRNTSNAKKIKAKLNMGCENKIKEQAKGER
jgi:hypothetical protein